MFMWFCKKLNSTTRENQGHNQDVILIMNKQTNLETMALWEQYGTVL